MPISYEKRKEYMRRYRENNKEKFREYMRNYYRLRKIKKIQEMRESIIREEG